ncbi:FAD/NAD-P-binding domain-containing protein [Obba rivulosa]|uniref:FAD/NAD-P-binding domain-containing protein n=1 Tax=Obba rivulosa TaxID=1052685 RepID=A0A8E2AHB8_9APHY|nr:FAD/NAD-P-binding domain-containing protein [Obba rivulosa]
MSAAAKTTMDDHTDSLPKAPLRLHILIIGCGMGGLAAAYCLGRVGHQVTVLEQATVIGEVGAGIQISPNVSRLLDRWGVGEAMRKVGIRPEAMVFRRYSTGEIVGYARLAERMEAFGGTYYHIHRADLFNILYSLAAPYMTLRLGATVVSVDPEAPSATLATGEVVHGDLIIGADGVKSFIQRVVLGKPSSAEPTGDAVYRAIIPTALMRADPELRPFVDTPEMTGWMGPQRHIMAYNIRAEEYNIVLAHPDDGSVESWTAKGSADKMRADFADFEPRVQKLLSFVDSTLKWRLMDRQPLETWVHPAGRVTLLGDACHAMLPYRAQGAAMAIEDAAVLGVLFSHIRDIAQLKPLLYAYEELRLPRTARTQGDARSNQKTFHLPDGLGQQARDENMRKAAQVVWREMARERGDVPEGGEQVDGTDLQGNSNQWADHQKNQEQFGYDAEAVAEQWWRDVGESQIGGLVSAPV